MHTWRRAVHTALIAPEACTPAALPPPASPYLTMPVLAPQSTQKRVGLRCDLTATGTEGVGVEAKVSFAGKRKGKKGTRGREMTEELRMSLAVLGIISVAVILPFTVLKLRAPTPSDLAERVVPLLNALAASPNDRQITRKLHQLLNGPPLEYRPDLDAQGGWFDRSVEALNIIIFHDQAAVFVQWFFHRFQFPAGRQQKPLTWLHGVLTMVATVGTLPPGFAPAAERLIATSSSQEAHWLYERVLDLVQQSAGNPNFKALAVRIGRGAYSAGRAGRTPTVYDEQAIANDVAARVA
jgi:hypothetical protein